MNKAEINNLLVPINGLLRCRTSKRWVEKASHEENIEVILTDHLICELKAAQSAMHLIRKYAVDEESSTTLLKWLRPFEDFAYRKKGNWKELITRNTLGKSISARENSLYGSDIIDKMVLLIKEELHHFFQVLEIMEEKGISYNHVSSSRYANGLLRHVRTYEPEALIDKLICGAFIEARSCERFAALAPHIEERLSNFYISLLRSEARHFKDYLILAEKIAGQDISERVSYFARIEEELIISPDPDLKFHSGFPM